MTSIVARLRINPSYPFIGRAAERSVVGSLNFKIANLAAAEVRRRLAPIVATKVDITPLLEKYGNLLDVRNEQDEAARAVKVEEQQREEQGLQVAPIPPLVLASRLKVIRDAMAEDLLKHARMLLSPLDNKTKYPDPFETAASLEESFVRQLAMQPKVSDVQVQRLAEAHNLSEDDIRRVLVQQQESGLRFLKDHREELLSIIRDFPAGVDGMAYDIGDAEEVEAGLPAIHRAGIYVAADRGLWYERDRWIKMLVRGHPDGSTNLALVDGARKQLHKEFDTQMGQPNFRREIDEAVQRGSTWPVLIDLPKPVEKKQAA